MSTERLPPQLLFGWLPKTRPALGPRLRWKDRIKADLRMLKVRNWFEAAKDRQAWRQICKTVPEGEPVVLESVCLVCGRDFKNRSGLSRHKCTAT